MSQSRFSIVLVGVSALLRRPLVSRLRPAAFTARGSGGFRRSGRPSVSALPLGELTFGLTTSAFRHAPLRSCCSASWPSGSWLPLFGTHRFGVAARRVGLRAHGFRFSACADSELPLGEFVLPPSSLEIAARRLAFGLTASAFRHAPLRRLPSAGWFCRLPFRRLPLGGLAFGLTASAFRHAPLRRLPSASWFFCLPLRSCRWAG